ncbi:MAG: hemerythrin domain-containing protein [Marinobacter sp.]|nr:hemerythrin domain-containing protein [Marinobacter sp.]
MIKALEKIQAEHRSIRQILNVLEESSNAARRGDAPEWGLVNLVLEYLETFIDQVHHPKEDKYLFSALAARSEDTRDLIEDLQGQHEQEAERLGRLRAVLVDEDPELKAFFQGS